MFEQEVTDFMDSKFGEETLLGWLEESHKATIKKTGLKVGTNFFDLCLTQVFANRITKEMEEIGFPSTNNVEYVTVPSETSDLFDEMVSRACCLIDFKIVADCYIRNLYGRIVDETVQAA